MNNYDNYDPTDSFVSDKFEGQIFYSTDGKLTVSVKAEGRANLSAAKAWAEAEYERLINKFGTKQAQAVREYRSEKPTNGFKNEPIDCKHTNKVQKVAQTQKNAGRTFESCLDCGKFVGWIPTHGIDAN